jgi:prepilin-type processing-associated H-X9-DG protein/prepilin-type N-terminal cleavage/methylation domain-containing protein
MGLFSGDTVFLMLNRVPHTKRQNVARGFSLMEVLAVVAIIMIMAALSLPALSAALEATRSSACAANLKQLGVTLAMYANEQHGKYPLLQKKVGTHCDRKNRGTYMFDGPSVFPEYVSDVQILVCPSNEQSVEEYKKGIWKNRYRLQLKCDFGMSAAENVEFDDSDDDSVNPCMIDDSSYTYFPWVSRFEWFMDDATMDLSEEFEIAMKALFEGGPRVLNGRVQFLDERDNLVAMLPLSQGIERFLITDVNNPGASFVGATQIPVMFDRVSFAPLLRNHKKEAANILFLDGHVDFIRFPSNNYYPMTSAWYDFMTYKKDRYL